MQKLIRNFENYTIDESGNVRNINGYKLTPTLDTTGYYVIDLCNKGKKVKFSIHRLVAEAFIPNPNNYKLVNHKDENKQNNNVDNLEWCTAQYNNTYGNRITKTKEKLNIAIVAENKKVKRLFASYTIAGKTLGVTQSCISYYFRAGKKGYGYKWRLATPKEIEELGNKETLLIKKLNY